MKTNTIKKILLTLLALLFVCSVSAFTLTGVKADDPATRVFQMNEGASIRLAENSNGIRFSATLSDYDQSNEYGFVIVPKRYIVDNEITDNYVTELNALATQGVISEPIILDSKVHTEDDKLVINGSISNILYDNINMEFVGIGFEFDGTDYNYASFDSIDDISRTAPSVATACLNELYYDANIDANDKILYQESESILKNYINESINKTAGLNETQSDATTPTWEVAFAQDSVSVEFGKTVQLSVSSNLPVSQYFYSSDNENITVDANGLVTAKASGTATITVKTLGVEDTCTVTATPLAVADGYLVDFNDKAYEYYIADGAYSGFWKADAVTAQYVDSNVVGAKDGDAMKVTVDIAKCRDNKGMSYFVINFLNNKGANLVGDTLQIRFRATYNDGANNVDPFGYIIEGTSTTAVLNGLDGSANVITVNVKATDADANGWRDVLVPVSSITGGIEAINSIGLIFYQYAGIDDGIGEIYLDYVKVSETLATPTNLAYADGTLTWDAVANATSYVVSYDGQEYPATTNSLEVPSGKAVKVKAIAEGYISSEWSAQYAIIDVPAGYIADFNSKGYESMVVSGIVDSYWHPASTTVEYVDSDVEGAENGDALALNTATGSSGTLSFEVSVPKTPSGSLNGEIIRMRFKLVDGSNTNTKLYFWRVNGGALTQAGNVVYTEADANGWRELTINTADKYAIQSIGFAFNELTKNSNFVVYLDWVKVGTVLQTPTNLAYADGTLTWDAVANATSYVVRYDGQEYPVTTNSIEVGSGKSVTVKAIGGAGYFDSAYSSAYVTVGIPDGYIVDFNDSVYESSISADSGDGWWKSDSVTATYVKNEITGAENDDALKLVIDKKDYNANQTNTIAAFKITFPVAKGANLTGNTIKLRFHALNEDGTPAPIFLQNINNGGSETSGISISEADANGWRELSIAVTKISGGAQAFNSLGLAFWQHITSGSTCTVYLDYVKVV